LRHPAFLLKTYARGLRTIMDYEHLVAGSARIVELAAVAVLLLGALFAAGAFARRLARHTSFHDAYHSLRADLGRRFCSGWSCS
jgi:hypothetical protein